MTNPNPIALVYGDGHPFPRKLSQLYARLLCKTLGIRQYPDSHFENGLIPVCAVSRPRKKNFSDFKVFFSNWPPRIFGNGGRRVQIRQLVRYSTELGLCHQLAWQKVANNYDLRHNQASHPDECWEQAWIQRSHIQNAAQLSRYMTLRGSEEIQFVPIDRRRSSWWWPRYFH